MLNLTLHSLADAPRTKFTGHDHFVYKFGRENSPSFGITDIFGESLTE